MITIKLNTTIKQGKEGHEVAELTLRTPCAGDLRGIKILDVIEMKEEAFEALLPRIVSPAITSLDVSKMQLDDLINIIQHVQGFFEGKSQTV